MMKSLIQPRWRTERIEEEVAELKRRFNLESIQDLVRLAKERYGVTNVIKTSLVLAGRVNQTPEGFNIFYPPSFQAAERLVLAHEIGHIATGHFNRTKPPGFLTREFEADYYSQLLTETSPQRYYALLGFDAALLGCPMISRSIIKKRERLRLGNKGLPLPD